MNIARITNIGYFILVVLMGVIMAFAFAPSYFWPIAPLSFYALITINSRIMNGISARMFCCFAFSFAFFITNLYWIANALDVSPEQFAWLKPFAILGIPLIISAPYSIIGICIHYANPRYQYLVVATTWFLLDALRSIIFPWALFGDISLSSIYFAQLSSVIGIYGMTWLVLVLCSIPASHNWRVILAGICVVVLGCGWGAYRLPTTLTPMLQKPRVLIIQPNLKNHMGDIELQQEWLREILLSTSQEQSGSGAEYVIWPEASFPFILSDDSNWFRMLGRVLQHNNKLVFGYDRLIKGSYPPILYNSMVAIDDEGEAISHYDKQILVPFGEYIPMRIMLGSLLQKITYGVYDFTPGTKNDLLTLGEVSAVPLVCYEVIFSRYLRKFDLRDADFILTVTNDSWLGDSAGPHQHFAMARMRAIEYGMPLIRAANSGISSVVDPYGRIVQQTTLGVKTVLHSSIPIKLQEKTIYYMLGDLVLIMVALLSIIITIYSRKIY